MGCNCGGGNRTIQSRTRQSAFRAAGSPLGFSADEPHQIGEPGGVTRRVRVLKAAEGLTPGQAAYVTGTGVDALVSSGIFHDITATRQKRRLWKVNGFAYTDLGEAERAARVLGVTPVEVA